MCAQQTTGRSNATKTFVLDGLSPDSMAEKERLVQSITVAIYHQVPYADHDLVADAVNETFDELLGQAKVTTHISALVEGIVRRKVREAAATDKLLMEPSPY